MSDELFEAYVEGFEAGLASVNEYWAWGRDDLRATLRDQFDKWVGTLRVIDQTEGTE